ncbi:pyridoxine kinase [Usnea florida]
MSPESVVPETRVLAIASHVVYGYVGNKMAAFVMQTMGCDVSILNTVQFSNHTGYEQFKGTKTSADEISQLYAGLKQSYLIDFDVLLTGYAPSAETVEAIGAIARDLKLRASTKPGSFFWVLDPVMGDQERLYVNEDVVPAYKNLLRDADLILPNQFEAELLSEVKITSLSTLQDAIAKLHKTYRIPHVIITSIRFPDSPSTMSVVGSTARDDLSPRIFRIDATVIDCFFSGTGDMFAALTVVRLREAVAEADLSGTKSWISSDDVKATKLPLAKATEKVIGSMHAILVKTKEARDRELEGMGWPLGVMEKDKDSDKRLSLRRTKAAEVRVVRCLEDLRLPRIDWKAKPLTEESKGL